MPSLPSPIPDPDQRRGFLAKATALGLGLVAYAVPSLAAVVAFLSPWRQKGQSGQSIRVAPLAVLPEDGTPRKFPVIADRTDAWNRFPSEPIGSVWLRRVGTNQVAALHVCCPHAGCHIGYDAEKKCFMCPCHTQPRFKLDGKREEGDASHSPRDMDSLEVEINGTEVWVKFQNFRTNTTDKIART